MWWPSAYLSLPAIPKILEEWFPFPTLDDDGTNPGHDVVHGINGDRDFKPTRQMLFGHEGSGEKGKGNEEKPGALSDLYALGLQGNDEAQARRSNPQNGCGDDP